ncbi:MAG: hypothetical protein ACE5HF_02380 [Gemmatimonadota bacterium]
MKRMAIALAALALLAGSGGIREGALARTTKTVDCTDYCAERAAEHCERIDSWRCSWYILGCLGGCKLAQL